MPTATERKVLHSWKDISNYTGRGVRTIQRYEAQLGFPVHRPAGKTRSAVLAFSDEIDAWLERGLTLRELAQAAVPILTEEQIRSRRRYLAVAAKAKQSREMAQATHQHCLLMAKRIEVLMQKLQVRQAAARRVSLKSVEQTS